MNATLMYLKPTLKLFCHLHLGLPSGSFLQDERLQFLWQFWYFRCMLLHVCPILHAFMSLIRRIQIIRRLPKGGGSRPVAPPPPHPPKPEFKKHRFCRHDYTSIKGNQPMKSEGDWCTGILKNKIKNLGIYKLFSFPFRAGAHRRFSVRAEIRLWRLNR